MWIMLIVLAGAGLGLSARFDRVGVRVLVAFTLVVLAYLTLKYGAL